MTGSFDFVTFAATLVAGCVLLLVAITAGQAWYGWRDRREARGRARRRRGYIRGRR